MTFRRFIKFTPENNELDAKQNPKVETFEGEVTLTGAVSKGEAKSHAADSAASVYGVKGVDTLLKVK